MLKLSSKSYVTVNGAAMAPQAARARGAICPLKSTRRADHFPLLRCDFAKDKEEGEAPSETRRAQDYRPSRLGHLA